MNSHSYDTSSDKSFPVIAFTIAFNNTPSAAVASRLFPRLFFRTCWNVPSFTITVQANQWKECLSLRRESSFHHPHHRHRPHPHRSCTISTENWHKWEFFPWNCFYIDQSFNGIFLGNEFHHHTQLFPCLCVAVGVCLHSRGYKIMISTTFQWIYIFSPLRRRSNFTAALSKFRPPSPVQHVKLDVKISGTCCWDTILIFLLCFFIEDGCSE